jgi:hypothetical protein
MGMFDELKCHYPLPLAGANALDYQTKDTPAQFLDEYEIRADGTLWHEAYDIEDRSELGKWKREHPGQDPPPDKTGIMSIAGLMTRVNKRWEQITLTGEIEFHTIYSIVDGKLKNAIAKDRWLSWSAYFVDGKLNQIHLLENSQ